VPIQSVTTLMKRWADEGTVVLPPASAVDVRETFAALGSVATADVVTLYGLIGGMERPDNELWRLWPLAEVSAENASRLSPFGVLFSDYMLSCWCYRLRPRDDDRSAVLLDRFDGQAPVVVAYSLSEFFDTYLVDAERLLDNRYVAPVA
jgi:hypothetical protein